MFHDGSNQSFEIVRSMTVSGLTMGAVVETTVEPGFGTLVGTAFGCAGGLIVGLCTVLAQEINDPNHTKAIAKIEAKMEQLDKEHCDLIRQIEEIEESILQAL